MLVQVVVLVSRPPHSSIRNHAEETCGGVVRRENFEIKNSIKNPVSLRLLESLYIFKLNPSLNDTNSSAPLNLVK